MDKNWDRNQSYQLLAAIYNEMRTGTKRRKDLTGFFTAIRRILADHYYYIDF